MAIKLALLVVFFGIMLAVGIHCRRHATDVNGFVLGGRSVGAWLTAFAYGTSYFSAVIFVGYAGQFGWQLRRGLHLDRPGQRLFGLAAGLGGARPPHAA